ncbi:hypothetical protein OG453_27390 [Streptomyces sp. NBC_01381]|uniref:hypothetical protein n=1 Tax=Streptomyces sp. NBC_01381 TaxID=2903845 RepID=UPI00225171B5|nr:hypothetical protein [Streptomyces sp. NBC_01381]MCX4670371.1 hypothetical protein [Streptomyces sp. NBC_01381]
MADHKDLDTAAVGTPDRGQRPAPPPSVDSTAWDAPSTRRAWRWHTVRTVLALAAWIGGWFVLLDVTQNTFHLASLVFIPYTVYAPYRLLMLLAGTLPGVFRMRRTLRGHPWRLIESAEHGMSAHPAAASDKPWIAVPDPEAPEDPAARLPLLLVAEPRARWWLRRVRPGAIPEQRAEIGVLWCCGDPRGDVVIAVSARPDGKAGAPRRLLLLQQRGALVASRRHAPPAASADPDTADLTRPALSHPPTARTMRGRMRRRALLLLVWPALLAVQIAEITLDEGHDKIGLVVIIAMAQLTGLPLHIAVLLSTRRMTRLLAAHPWRPVDCTIRSRGKTQLITVDGQVLTPSPWRVYVDVNVTRLWVAGDQGSRCMVSMPGGARPVSVAPTP